ncbi:MAG: M6 family metalloprotease domain-containing protein [Bacteroidales bacterium]|nr:M6 family metalloprotease domain-containing protein [Bacteroidales bacterium]
MRLKIVISIMISLMVGLSALASPARKGRILLTQPDGSSFTAFMKGDEYLRIKTTEDGHAVIQEQDGWWCYAIFNADGSRQSSGCRIGEPASHEVMDASARIPYGELSRIAEERRSSRGVQEDEPMMKVMLESRKAQTRADEEAFIKHGLVILAQFRDVSFSHTKEDFERLLNEEGYNLNGATGCAKEYFDSQFDGAVEFRFDVSDIVTLTRNRAFFGANNSDGEDKNPAEMIVEACRLADSQIDYSLYDDNNDGTVDNIFVFFAGEDEAEGASEDCIWSHAWHIKSATGNTLDLDGKKINRYACSAELTRIQSGDELLKQLSGIGTFCHEYCHTFGLPDLYDTDYDDKGGWAAGVWGKTSLMDSGNQNNHGNTPPNFNALERELLGLADPVLLTEPGSYRMGPVHRNGQFYRMDTDTEGEYYLMECRKAEGWDSHIGGSGMLVYHIDRSSGATGKWTIDNTVNAAADHQCADLIEADSRKDSFEDTQEYMTLTSNLAGVFFPYGDVNSLTAESSPGLTFWSGAKSSVSIVSITKDGDDITFNVIDNTDEISPPSASAISAIAFPDAAIIRFESSYVYDGNAEVAWGRTGEETETTIIKPYEPGRYALLLEGLQSTGKTYSVSVSFTKGGIQGESKTISFMTKRAPSVKWPYIYIPGNTLDADGSIAKGSRIPLRIYNASGAAAIRWQFNGKDIDHEGDFHHTFNSDGTLKATVSWEDGSTDIILKEIVIRE